MKVRMLSTQRGCDDGIHAREYAQGEVFDLSVVLANCFIAEGHAEHADAAPARTPAAEAPITRPKRNAAQKTPQRRKGKKA